MSSVSEVKTVLTEIKQIVANVVTDVNSLIAQVLALKEQVANGGVATQADLEEIFALAQEVKVSIESADALEPPVV